MAAAGGGRSSERPRRQTRREGREGREKTYDHLYKLVLVGDYDVGKQELIRRFIFFNVEREGERERECSSANNMAKCVKLLVIIKRKKRQ